MADYETKLTPEEESGFQAWKSTNAPNDSGADYDLRGAFKAGISPAENGHWPDTFKKPDHPTFSDESQYAVGADAAKAGHWDGDTFIPPPGETKETTAWRLREEPGTKIGQMPPTLDEFFGGPSKLPTLDEFFAPKAQATPGGMGYGLDTAPVPMSSPELDNYVSQTTTGRVLDAFGQGLKNGWGSEPLGLSDESNDALKKLGVFNDYTKGQTSLIKSANEVLMRPAAAAIDAAWRAAQAGFGAYQSTAAQTGQELEGTPVETGMRAIGLRGPAELGHDIAAMPEAFMGSPEPMGIPHGPRVPSPADLVKAHDLGIIGGDEATWKGTSTSGPVNAQFTDALKAQISDVAKDEGPVSPTDTPQAAPAPVPDIHAAARQVDPDTFDKFDALSQRKDVFRRWIGELDDTRQQAVEAAAPHADEIASLEEKIPDTTPRLAKKYQARLDDMQAERQAYIEENTKGDNADMAKIRGKLMETDYAMRDLAPKVSEAYRSAQEQMPKEAAPTEAPALEAAPQTSEVVPPTAEAAPVEGQAQAPAEAQPEIPVAVKAEAAPEPAPVTTPAQAQSITADVSKKVSAAGLPSDVADATGRLWASHYWARAQRFGGAKGNGLDLYNAEAPDVVGKNVKRTNRVAEFASGVKGKLKVTADGIRNIMTLFRGRADASTVIHETGHQWLEEMMGDAADKDAPADLKADGDTVLKWLGLKSGDELKEVDPTSGKPTKKARDAHEKFARGFETYMMEGRAPSTGLAKVFEQFRQWLTSIYQTVAKLRAPINDDIRDVFDRLIVSKPEKTVIASEREAGKGFADLHISDAETTPPEHADVTADRVRQEADKVVIEKAPEIADEIGARPTTEAIGNENANPEIASDRNAPGPDAGEGGAGKEPGTIVTGGNDAAADGAPIRAKPRSAEGSAASGGGATNPPDSPHAVLPEPKSDLIDKAGNIRLDKLNQPDDIDQVIRDTATKNNNFLPERRGVISDGQALDLADALGKSPEFLDLKKIGQAFNEEEIIAAKTLLNQSATAVRDLMPAAAKGGQEALVALAQAISRHEMIQGKVAQATAEWGRAGRALRMVMAGAQQAADLSELLKKQTGRDLYQLQEMAKYGSRLKSPAQVSKLIADTSFGKIKRAIIYYYINVLISGPITHMRYSVGNAINALWTPLVEIPSAAAWTGINRAIGNDVSNPVHLVEAFAQLYAIGKGSRDGFSAAYEAFRSGQSPALPAERISQQFIDINATHPIPGPIGTAIGVPGRSVAAIHSFFKSLRYEQNIQGLAYRQAMKEELSGDARDARIAELTSTPTDDMMAAATKDALKELFMAPTDYHSTMGSLTRAANSSLIGKIIVPFMKIGTQITRNAFIERTPLGIFDKEVRANLMGENGGAARDMQLGKMTGGIALMGITVGLAAEGMATGDGPEDPKQRATWLLNHKPNHITIGDISVPYQGLGHLGMLMRFSANMYETAHGWDGEDGAKLAIAGLQGLSKSVLDENFMRGVKDLLDAVYHPQEYGPGYVKQFVTNWLPFSVGSSQIARQIDPYMRDTHGSNVIESIFKAARAKTPFVSESLYARRDMFGEPIQSGGLNPNYTNDPVVQAMESLHKGIGQLPHKIRGVELTDQQYDDFSRIAGRMTKMRLNAIVNMPGFGMIPNQQKSEMIDDTIKNSRDAARSLIMMQPGANIIQRANEAKAVKHGMAPATNEK